MPDEAGFAAPITVTIGGNLAATVRFFAFCDETLPEEFIIESVMDHVHAASESICLGKGTEDRMNNWLMEDAG